MSQRHHFRAGDKLMVHYLIHGLLRIIMIGKYHAGTAVAEQRIVPVRWLLISLKVIQYFTLC